MPGTPTTAPNGSLSVHFVHVGQGSATLVAGPTGETMLVDTGDWQDDGQFVLEYLKERNVTRIDHLVATHPDADHIGGHEAVVDHYETHADGVGTAYGPGLSADTNTYREYRDALSRHDVPLRTVDAGDAIPLDGVSVRVLSPPADRLAGGDRNENSVVLRLVYGDVSVLLTGDVESKGERYLLDAANASVNTTPMATVNATPNAAPNATMNVTLDSTALQLPHHGSNSSSSGPFLDAVGPRLAVIQSGYDSQYGHPHRPVLDRLANRSVRTYWTGVHGDVRLRVNATAVTVATQANATAVPLQLRTAPAVGPGSNASLAVRAVLQIDDATTDPTRSMAAALSRPGSAAASA